LLGLYQSIIPLSRAGVDAGKRVTYEDVSTNLDVENTLTDDFESEKGQDDASNQLENAKKKVEHAIGRGVKQQRKRKVKEQPVESKRKVKKCKDFDLFDD